MGDDVSGDNGNLVVEGVGIDFDVGEGFLERVKMRGDRVGNEGGKMDFVELVGELMG